MVEVTPVRTVDEYEAALERIGELLDAPPGSAASDELEVLGVLVERYEDRHHPVPPPDPVAAIEFRMDQADLAPRDLIPHLGSRARVSEVLARKRPLTMAMARSLHKHLDIPAESLIQPATTPMELPLTPLDVDSFPLAEMASFGWIAPVSEVEVEAHELIDDLYTRAFGISPAENPGAMVAMGSWGEHANPAAIQAWCLQAAAAAHASPLANAFVPGVVTPAFLHAVARLSVVDDGPRLAQAHLAEHGISLQIVPQLPGTHLDGAVLWPMGSYPVIALTLREDRLARFWNGLLHELAHLGLHAKLGAAGFLDDLDLPAIDPLEQQAEEWAREALIPSKAWDAWMIQTVHTEADVASFAAELGIHAMIVAERLREESNDRRRFPRLVGKGLVGPLFGVPSSAQA